MKNHTTLLEALQALSPDSSNRTLRSWIKSGRVLVNERPSLRENHEIGPSDRVELEKKRQSLHEGVILLYEDRQLLVIDKPEGLLSVATDFIEENTLHALLKRRAPKASIYPVHRLDRDTSGVMVFAKCKEAKEKLKDQFEAHTIERCYIALVKGELTPESGTWRSHLAEAPNYMMKSVSKGGKEAITHYKVLKRRGERSLVELTLETGRKNQIRVHCQNAGHPIIGDKKYGDGSPSSYKRLCLHATTLSFTHPITGKRYHFKSTLTPSFIGR